MAVRFLFFNSTPTDDRVYYAQDFADNFDKTHESGLLHPYGQGQLNLKAEVKEGMTTIVNLGLATLRGHYFEVYGEPYELNHQLPDTTYNRIDRIVIRLDSTHNERNILPHVKTGNPAQSPQAPSLTRNKDIYEISLGQILVRANTAQFNQSDLVDERSNDELCGPAYLKLPIKPEQIQDVMDAWFASEDKEMFLKRSDMGIANGVATLGANGRLTPSQGLDYVPKTEKGIPNGVATIGADGRVPNKQLGYYSPSNVIIKNLSNVDSNIAGGVWESLFQFSAPFTGKFRVTGAANSVHDFGTVSAQLELRGAGGEKLSATTVIGSFSKNPTNFSVDGTVNLLKGEEVYFYFNVNAFGRVEMQLKSLAIRGSI